MTIFNKGVKVMFRKTLINPIGNYNLLRIVQTNRYGTQGMLSNNQGYLKVYRNVRTGRFVKRTWFNRLFNKVA